jgi:putative oxidoreductase
MLTSTLATPRPAIGFLSRIDTRAVLRFHAGVFFLPQIYYKYASFDGIAAFLGMAHFYPAPLWVVAAGVVELVAAVGLMANIFAKYAALLSVAVLAVAASAVVTVRGLGWLFNHGGVEYHVFWGLICLYVFIDEWQKSPGLWPIRR